MLTTSTILSDGNVLMHPSVRGRLSKEQVQKQSLAPSSPPASQAALAVRADTAPTAGGLHRAPITKPCDPDNTAVASRHPYRPNRGPTPPGPRRYQLRCKPTHFERCAAA